MTLTKTDELYIGGRWTTPEPCSWIEVVDPFTEELTTAVPSVVAADVAGAVTAARAACEAWGRLSFGDRAALLARLHEELASRQGALVAAIVSDVGTPLKIAERVQVGLPLNVLKSYIELASDSVRDERIGNSLVVREPVGVVAAITPWNYPLHQIMCKLAPALLTGSTVVLKPSEIAPRVAWELFAAIHAAGFPPGVVNLISGAGRSVGEALVSHAEVDMVSFTGSQITGSRVASLAAGGIKRVALELGGKSANVILDDADLARAVKSGVSNAFLNAGQTCTALTRMLVPADRHEEAVQLAQGFVESFAPGDPREPTTRLGPLVSAGQRERVRGFIERAVRDGARLVTGGAAPPAGVTSGYFVSPTLFADVDPDSELAQEEVFGPVLSIIPVRDEDHALEVANNSRYGLAGAVWSASSDRAQAFARRMRTGSVDINGAAFNALAPFGGYKKSGVGRELGRWALDEFTQLKSIQS